jgi:phage I-like protein
MEELKNIFGENALTYAQFAEALEKADKKTLNLANLAKGGYVGKEKFTAKETELAAANNTIRDLQDAAKKWDGVDVDKLKGDMAALQTKYDSDLAAAKLDNAINLALVEAKARDPKLVKALLDMSVIKQDGDSLLGMKDQLEKITSTHSYLFAGSDPVDPDPTTRTNTAGAHVPNNKPDFAKMSDSEYYEYMAANKK